MIYSICSIVVLILSILSVLILVIDFNGLISKRFPKGKTTLNVIKIVTPFVCVLGLFIMGAFYYYSKDNECENIIVIEIYKLFCYTIRSLVFDIESRIISPLISSNSLYRLSWCVAYPLCVLTSYISILNSIFHRIVNKCRVRLALKNCCDILIGSEYADTYKQKCNNNLILWIDEDISKEKEMELIKVGIPYLKKDFTMKSLLSLPSLKKSIKRKIKFYKNEYNYYLINTTSFINNFLSNINQNIEKALNRSQYNSECIDNICSDVSIICEFYENKEIQLVIKEIEKLIKNSNKFIDYDLIKQKVVEILNWLKLDGFNIKLINQIKNIFTDLLSQKDYNLMIKKIEELDKGSKGKLIRKLKETFVYEINEAKEIDYHFISFKDEVTNLKYLSEFKQFLETNKLNLACYQTRNYFLHIELTNSNLMSIQNKIQEESNELSPFLLFFNRYQLHAVKFNEENPITKHLPKSFFNDFGAISNPNFNCKYELNFDNGLNVKTDYEKNINVIYLGFGKVSRELYKLSVMNNQLVSYCTDDNVLPDNRYHNHIVNYFAFDKETFKVNDKNSLFFSNRFDNIKDELKQEYYYQFPENTSNFYSFDSDINDIDTYKSFVKLLKYRNDQTYTQIVVSLDSDLENIDYALKVLMLLKQERIQNYHLYVRLQKEEVGVIELLDDEKVTFFGYISDVFNHDIIVKDSLMKLAKLTNKKYNMMKLSNTSWYKLHPIKQKSNLYASINIRLKLNLLGFDYKRLSKDELKLLSEKDKSCHESNLKELKNKLNDPYKKYDDYLFFKKDAMPNISNILSFQEHSRWNAFYLGFGYIPMAINDVKIDKNNNVYKDDNTLKQHICLTTYQELDFWHHQFAKLLSQINDNTEEENLIAEQTYQYDYMLVGQFKSLFEDLENNRLLLIKK